MTLFDDDAGPAQGGQSGPGERAPIPTRLSFKALREAAQDCRACELWEGATQAVLGTGPTPGKARLMLIGEQPGDREDIEGLPFVGPAGRVLDQGLERAGIASGASTRPPSAPTYPPAGRGWMRS
jgi:DNA polymerase